MPDISFSGLTPGATIGQFLRNYHPQEQEWTRAKPEKVADNGYTTLKGVFLFEKLPSQKQYPKC